jgi:D-arginine dehydrogenase
LAPLPLRSARRHLALLIDTDEAPDPRWPFVWHKTESFYFRPESGGLLASGCEVDYVEPADVGIDGEAVEQLAERALGMLAGASRARIRRAWAGLRTLTPDGRFVVGPDPRAAGLYWCAGLGGHGMTTSSAVGELLADLVVEGSCAWFDPEPLLPARFLV